MPEIKRILQTRRERRLTHLRRKEAGRRWAVLSTGMVLSLCLAGLILASALAYAGLTRELPSIEGLPGMLNPVDGSLLKPTQIYDRSGQHVLASFGIEDSPRSYIPLDESNETFISPEMARVVVAALDPSFWQHSGYSLSDWRDPARHPTIAQRLVSDLLLYGEKPSMRRALRERILAAQVTARFGRSQVLEWYLNSADFGSYAFGVESASQLYFGKPAADLSLGESAVLAAVLQAPSLNPVDARQVSLERGQQLLEDLQEAGYITDEEMSEALSTGLDLRPTATPETKSSEAFINLVLAQLEGRFARTRIERGGLSIITTLDYDLQQKVSCLTGNYAARLQRLEGSPRFGCAQAGTLAPLPAGLSLEDASTSAMILDPTTGQVLAVAGETLAGWETPLLAAHDPGSLLAPFVYLTGFTRGMSPASLVWDIPGLVDIQNFDGTYHGPLRMRTALANDYRVPVESVRLQVGNENVEKITASFGLATNRPVHLLEIAGAYGAFATQGVYYGQEFGDVFGPSTVLRVDTVDGENWLDWSMPQARPVVTAGLAYLVTNILSDEAARWPSLGSPSVVEIGRPAGVKLGQTQDGLDAWTAGYTPERVVVSWVGSRANTNLSPHLPAILWSALMQAASQGTPRDGWPVPEGVTVMDVCDPSGLLPTSDCPSVVSEIFLQGSEPTQADTLYRSYQVNRETGSLATVFTPPQFVEKKVYMMVPREAQSWAQAAGIPTPPSSYDAIQPPAVDPDVNIRAPRLFADVSGVLQIVGTASGADFDHYRLQAGQGLNPQEWIQIGQDSSVPVEDGVLAEWDTHGLDGLYALQLVVVRSDQRVETAVIQVNIINP